MTPELKRHATQARRDILTWHILAAIGWGLFYLVFLPFLLAGI